MKEEKTIYSCDRCGKAIDSLIFSGYNGIFRKIISANEYEIVKGKYLLDDVEYLPDAKVIVLSGVSGYCRKNIKDIHFCSECTKDFKKFMRRVDETDF